MSEIVTTADFFKVYFVNLQNETLYYKKPKFFLKLNQMKNLEMKLRF